MSFKDKITALELLSEADCLYQGQEYSMDDLITMHIRAYKKKQTPVLPRVTYVNSFADKKQ
jgi:hypothetical protein